MYGNLTWPKEQCELPSSFFNLSVNVTFQSSYQRSLYWLTINPSQKKKVVHSWFNPNFTLMLYYGVCKNASQVFLFSCLYLPSIGKYNSMHPITLKRQRYPDVGFIGRVKSTAQLQARVHFTLILRYESFSLLKTLQWLWNVEQQ
jgi:hypothetical protein